jgi:hypothetical protein
MPSFAPRSASFCSKRRGEILSATTRNKSEGYSTAAMGTIDQARMLVEVIRQRAGKEQSMASIIVADMGDSGPLTEINCGLSI